MSYYGYAPYVPMAKRREQARRKMDKLRKQGMEICPIEIENRKITTTFWGSAWCDHIELFSDYANRLPRGRTYVRNGSVCHLEINEGEVEALVSGSSLYQVKIQIGTLSKDSWSSIKSRCIGKISSIIELLSGKISEGVMQVVCDPRQGLFPGSKEIKVSCSCLDWADMCKHVAAVLYGVGARLDHAPEKIFLLRGVDHQELIAATDVVIDTTSDSGSQSQTIASTELSDVFGIDIANTLDLKPAKRNAVSTRNKMKSSGLKKEAQTEQTKPIKLRDKMPKYFTGNSIYKKRKNNHLTQEAFGKMIGVSATMVSNWEKQGRYKLKLHEKTNNALLKFWKVNSKL